MIVAVYADSRKQSTKFISDISKQLSKKNISSEQLVVSLDNAPQDTLSPYIKSSYDTHSRYNHLNIISKYANTKDVLFVMGYQLDTILRESHNIKSNHELRKYSEWLSQQESISYGIPGANLSIILPSPKSDKKDYTRVKKLPAFKNTYFYYGNISKAIKIIIKNKTAKKDDRLSLYKLLIQRATGLSQPIKIANATDIKMPNKDINSLRKKYIQIAGVNSYGAFLSIPLITETDIPNSEIKMHSQSIEKVISAVATRQFYPERETDISFYYSNEIALTNVISNAYNADLPAIGINKRRRLLETFLLHDEQKALLNFPFIKIQSKLSYYDFLLLTNITTLEAYWELPSAKYGFVDVGDKPGSDILEEIFDLSSFAANSENLDGTVKNLLLGHLNMFYINISLANLILLLNNSKDLNGSEYLINLRQDIIDRFSVKYPLVSEIINI